MHQFLTIKCEKVNLSLSPTVHFHLIIKNLSVVSRAGRQLSQNQTTQQRVIYRFSTTLIFLRLSAVFFLYLFFYIFNLGWKLS